VLTGESLTSDRGQNIGQPAWSSYKAGAQDALPEVSESTGAVALEREDVLAVTSYIRQTLTDFMTRETRLISRWKPLSARDSVPSA
jgi:hypothetical protein